MDLRFTEAEEAFRRTTHMEPQQQGVGVKRKREEEEHDLNAKLRERQVR